MARTWSAPLDPDDRGGWYRATSCPDCGGLVLLDDLGDDPYHRETGEPECAGPGPP